MRHWSHNPQDRLDREIRRRTGVVRRYMTISREEPEEELKALKPTPKKHAAKSVKPDDAPCTT